MCCVREPWPGFTLGSLEVWKAKVLGRGAPSNGLNHEREKEPETCSKHLLYQPAVCVAAVYVALHY